MQIPRTLVASQAGKPPATFAIRLDLRAQIALAPIRIDLLCTEHTDRLPSLIRKAAQAPDRRINKDLKADIGRNGISRQTDERNAVVFTKCQRFPRAHIYTPEIHFAV